MKKFVKPATLLPVVVGAVVGVLLFWLGASDDAPGLCLIGLTIVFLLTMWGINNSGAIKKGLFAPIILFCFGTGGIILSIALLLDGELEESPGLALIGVALGVALIIIAAIRLNKAKARKS